MSRAGSWTAASRGRRREHPRGASGAVDLREAAGLVVGERLPDLRLRVHDERPVAGDGLAQGLAGQEEEPGSGPGAFGHGQAHAVAGAEQAELPILDRAAVRPPPRPPLEDVHEGVVTVAERLLDAGPRAEGPVLVDDRRARVDHGA